MQWNNFTKNDLSDEIAREREFGAFDMVDDSYDKLIITLTKDDYSTKKIKQINIFEFLMNDDF